MNQLKIEYVQIDSIKPYEFNAKEHPDEQIEQIKKSIEEFGMDDPLGIWHGEIVEGHGRYMALQQLGYKEVPIVRLDHLTEEQRRAYAIVHNQLTMNTGFDIELLNQELEAIDDIDMEDYGFVTPEEEAEVVEDDYQPEPPKEPKARLGDIYQLGEHRLMCGDSTNEADVEKLMDGKLADLVVTDPPYNVAINDGTIEDLKARKKRTDGLLIQNDNMTDEEFSQFLYRAFENIYLSLKDKRAFYIWFSSSNHVTFEQALIETGLTPRQEIIWHKNRFVFGRQDYQWKHEPCFYGWKNDGDGTHYFTTDRTQETVIKLEDKDIQKMKKSELVEILEKILDLPGTVIECDRPTSSKLHPTMKPIKLIETLIRNSSKSGEIVLDLFGGSGSTLMACEQMNRVSYTMEYDPAYVDVIINRWEEFTGRKAELIHDEQKRKNIKSN